MASPKWSVFDCKPCVRTGTDLTTGSWDWESSGYVTSKLDVVSSDYRSMNTVLVVWYKMWRLKLRRRGEDQ